MTLEGKNIGYVFTGSYCTFKKSIEALKQVVNKKANVIPIMSYNSYNEDTKFGKAQDFIKDIENITGNNIIHTIQDAEPIGPKHLTDIMIVCPASRKYNIKNFKWYNRYSSINGCKITFKKWKSSSNCDIY